MNKIFLRFLKSPTHSLLLICGIGLFLTACVTYGPQNPLIRGAGYNDVQLAPNTWRISYSDLNALGDRARDLALVRAAWLCKQNGYPWFTITATRDQLDGSYVSYGNVPYDDPNNYLLTSSIMVYGLRSQAPGAMNSAFLLSSLTRKYRITEADLRK